MLFRQLFDHDSSTYTYLLADDASRRALIIDPVLEQLDRDSSLIEELELDLVWALDTHVHADHVTAIGLLGRRFGARTALSERSGCVSADRLVKHGDLIELGAHALEVRETPGHTSGCVSYVCATEGKAFTGDALLIRGCGRTDFQQGDASLLFHSVREQLMSLPDATLLYPAHDYKGRSVSSVAEEKRHNPRLGLERSLEEFERIMRELHLPRPGKMSVAVPSNLRCGLSSDPAPAPAHLERDWAPIALSEAGVPEIDSVWLREHLADVLVLDVREPDEFRGHLGHVPGAELSPLRTLAARSAELPRARPIVTVCRSGGRSGKAALQLLEAGLARVASLTGGMTAWAAAQNPTDHGPPATHWSERQG